MYRSLVAGRRMLIVLDNARDPEQIRPLLPGSPGSAVVITSRSKLSGLVATDGAQLLTVELLSTTDARDLLARRLGAGRLATDPQSADEIIETCGRLPLALAIVAARAAAQPHFPLRALATELRAGRLDGFGGSDPATDIRTVFSWSYRTLSTEAAWLFRLLGLHPGPELAAPAVASLAGLPMPRTRLLLTELTEAHLITEPTPGRYALHDLLHAYAADLAAHAAGQLLWPEDGRVPPPSAEPGVMPETLLDQDRALTWFTTEHRVLLAIVEAAAKADLVPHVWQLAAATVTFLDRRGHWHDWAAAQRLALTAAQRHGDVSAEAYANRFLGGALMKLNHHQEAASHYRRALDLFAEIDDAIGQAFTHRSLGWVAEEAGDLGEALRRDLCALELFRAAGHHAGEANTLNSVGWCHAQLGDMRQAIACCEEALALLQRIGDRSGIATALDSLGYAHLKAGDYHQSREFYQRSADLYHDIGDRHGRADALAGLGDAAYAAGDGDAAGRVWRQALEILDALGHPDADRIRVKLRQLDRDRP
jgi:tetratricopeptide (TPR) repeat protein